MVLTDYDLNANTQSFVSSVLSDEQTNANLCIKVNVLGKAMFARANVIHTLPSGTCKYICETDLANLNNLLVKVVQILGAQYAIEPLIK